MCQKLNLKEKKEKKFFKKFNRWGDISRKFWNVNEEEEEVKFTNHRFAYIK